MKKSLLVVASLSAFVFGLAIGVPTASGNSVSIKVPFAFYVEEQLMPAGQYRFEMASIGGLSAGSLLRISTKDGAICRHLLTLPVGDIAKDHEVHVTFSKYGDSYFLVRVLQGDVGAELHKSAAEKKIASTYPKPASVDLRPGR